jgi:hypothetical protein
MRAIKTAASPNMVVKQVKSATHTHTHMHMHMHNKLTNTYWPNSNSTNSKAHTCARVITVKQCQVRIAGAVNHQDTRLEKRRANLRATLRNAAKDKQQRITARSPCALQQSTTYSVCEF